MTDARATVPVCPCTVRAMKASQDAWNAQISRRETAELIAALEKHGYISPAAEARMKKLRELHS